MKRMSGFTLIEALVTMTVVAVLVSAAVPSFKTTIQNGRLVTQANDLLGALIYARSQALTVNANVVICASTDQTTCSTDATAWKSGWIIGTGTPSSLNSPLLRVHEGLTGGNSLTNSASIKSITFGAGTGLPTTGPAYPIYFGLCDSRSAGYGRSIYLSATGEARVSPTVGKQIDGTAITC